MAERIAVDGEEFTAICGQTTINRSTSSATAWVVSCASPLAWTGRDGVQRFYMQRAASEFLIRPITPPPGSTEDATPVEHGIAHA